jgi:hypothetical protein
MSFGRVTKRFQREQQRRERQKQADELDTVFAEHEERVRAFLKTAGEQTISGQRKRRRDALHVQDADQLVHKLLSPHGERVIRPAHFAGMSGARKKNLAQLDGDEPYE